MKEFIQYYVEEVSRLSPLNKNYFGTITYFDGENIIATESPRMETKDDCWKWIAEEFKKLKVA